MIMNPKEETDEMMKDLAPIGNTPVAPATGIAAIALNMALKYHDINTVQDGTLYQQYKLEGKNMQELHLDHVFDTAIKMEMYLLGASDRIAKIVVDAIAFKVDDDKPETADEDPTVTDKLFETEVMQLFCKGDRVSISKEGLDACICRRAPNRQGTVVRFGTYISVRWDGLKSVYKYHPTFIKIDPTVTDKLFETEETMRKAEER